MVSPGPRRLSALIPLRACGSSIARWTSARSDSADMEVDVQAAEKVDVAGGPLQGADGGRRGAARGRVARARARQHAKERPRAARQARRPRAHQVPPLWQVDHVSMGEDRCRRPPGRRGGGRATGGWATRCDCRGETHAGARVEAVPRGAVPSGAQDAEHAPRGSLIFPSRDREGIQRALENSRWGHPSPICRIVTPSRRMVQMEDKSMTIILDAAPSLTNVAVQNTTRSDHGNQCRTTSRRSHFPRREVVGA